MEKRQKIPFRAGCVSDGSFLRRRIQLFIAYLYKPEVQAKVFKRSKAFLPRRRKDREEAKDAEAKGILATD